MVPLCGVEQVLEEQDIARRALDGLDHEGVEGAAALVLNGGEG